MENFYEDCMFSLTVFFVLFIDDHPTSAFIFTCLVQTNPSNKILSSLLITEPYTIKQSRLTDKG